MFYRLATYMNMGYWFNRLVPFKYRALMHFNPIFLLTNQKDFFSYQGMSSQQINNQDNSSQSSEESDSQSIGDMKKKKHILIVEDDRVTILYYEKLISKMKLPDMEISVHHVYTGERAIDYCKENPVNLVLMDIKLPGLDGLETTKRIKAINSDIVIIAQTAYALSRDYWRSLSAGCDDYIAKPISNKKLLEKLRTYL